MRYKVSGTKEDLEWQSSNEHSHEQLGTIWSAPHMKMWGFRGKKDQKVHPNFATNIAMDFHCHAFCTPKIICHAPESLLRDSVLSAAMPRNSTIITHCPSGCSRGGKQGAHYRAFHVLSMGLGNCSESKRTPFESLACAICPIPLNKGEVF